MLFEQRHAANGREITSCNRGLQAFLTYTDCGQRGRRDLRHTLERIAAACSPRSCGCPGCESPQSLGVTATDGDLLRVNSIPEQNLRQIRKFAELRHP